MSVVIIRQFVERF